MGFFRLVLMRKKPIRLIETVYGGNHQVDRDKHVISGVKILGRESRNGREYSEPAMHQAAKLYEGMRVNIDHPDRKDPGAERGLAERFGLLKNVRVEGDGAYGDLHYLESHPLAGMVLEMAERMPESFGLSHNAQGKEAKTRGKRVVESVESVRSVDIVGEPATTAGLFESQEKTVKRTIRQLLESNPKIVNLREMDEPMDMPIHEMDGEEMPMGDVEAEVPAEASGQEQVMAAFKAMINAILDDPELPTVADMLPKIKEVLQAQEKLLGTPAPAAEETVVEGEDEEEKMAESFRRKESRQLAKLVESLTKEVKSLKAERSTEATHAHCKSLLESAKREASESNIQFLMALDSDSKRKQLIETWPRTDARKRPDRSPGLLESKQPDSVNWNSHDEFVSLIK